MVQSNATKEAGHAAGFKQVVLLQEPIAASLAYANKPGFPRCSIHFCVAHHARYVTFHLAEVAVPGRLYRAILDRIRRFAAISPRAAPI